MMTCQTCGHELVPNAKFCANCGAVVSASTASTTQDTQQSVATPVAPQPQITEPASVSQNSGNPQQKNIARLMYVLGLLVVVVVAAMVAFLVLNKSDKPAATNTPAPTPTAKTSDSLLALGKSIDLKGKDGESMNVTVVKVLDPITGINNTVKPAAGNHFVGIQITVKNTGTDKLSQSADNNLTLYDTQNKKYAESYYVFADCESFQSGLINLAAGESATGCVPYEIPTNVKLGKVTFIPDSGNASSTGSWKL